MFVHVDINEDKSIFLLELNPKVTSIIVEIMIQSIDYHVMALVESFFGRLTIMERMVNHFLIVTSSKEKKKENNKKTTKCIYNVNKNHLYANFCSFFFGKYTK